MLAQDDTLSPVLTSTSTHFLPVTSRQRSFIWQAAIHTTDQVFADECFLDQVACSFAVGSAVASRELCTVANASSHRAHLQQVCCLREAAMMTAVDAAEGVRRIAMNEVPH